eukprot:CFRG4644T1
MALLTAVAVVVISLELNAALYHNMPPTAAAVYLVVNPMFWLTSTLQAYGIVHMNTVFSTIGKAARYVPKLYQQEVSESDHIICGISVRQFTPTSLKTTKTPTSALLYLHGGGFTIGDVESYSPLLRYLTYESGSVVFAPEYSLAPHAQYPQALEEIDCVLEWIHDNSERNGIDKERLGVIGDSAGGTLATALSLKVHTKEKAIVSIKQQILLYPTVDPAYIFSKSMSKYGDRGIGLPRHMMLYFWNEYIGDNDMSVLDDFLFAPMKTPASILGGLPPAYVLYCEHDILRSEGEAYATKLANAGVPTVLEEATGQFHGFLLYASSDNAPGAPIVRKLADYLKENL